MTEFDDRQKQWLQGFVSGIEARKAADRLSGHASGTSAAQQVGPDALQHAAQDRTTAAGGKLVAEEESGMPLGLGLETIIGFAMLMRDNRDRQVFAKLKAGM